MPIYDFNSDYTVQSKNLGNQIPQGLREIPAVRQLGHSGAGRNPFDGTDFLAYPSDVEEFLIPGFRSLDDTIKQYWSGIRVPTKDSYRFMRVKISGGDKSLLVWADDLKEGRARLPLAAISRESHEYNPDKFSPPYAPISKRFVNTRKTLVAKVYRPVPFNVNYTLTIWTEHKRDAEYILYQILTRFNPLAEFKMFDGKLQGNIQMKFGGSTDASEKETGYDQHANVRYEASFTAEAWLPIPEEIVPTVLGRVTTLNEKVGQVLLASQGGHGYGAPYWKEPVQTTTDAAFNRTPPGVFGRHSD